ncbi:MAG: hypothetical protein ACTSWA_05635 [Candidatus Thorarchaeota archaeon]
MTENSRKDFEIEIERNNDGISIKARGIQIDNERLQFKEAYKLVQELWFLAEILDIEVEQEFWHLIGNRRTHHLWDKSNQLSDEVSDNAHRIALCLLREYPQCKTQREIEEMSNVPRSTAGDNLSGNIESVGQYFRKCKKGYQLSKSGIEWLSIQVIPQYVSTR